MSDIVLRAFNKAFTVINVQFVIFYTIQFDNLINLWRFKTILQAFIMYQQISSNKYIFLILFYKYNTVFYKYNTENDESH